MANTKSSLQTKSQKRKNISFSRWPSLKSLKVKDKIWLYSDARQYSINNGKVGGGIEIESNFVERDLISGDIIHSGK